ncbi:hypothetical protein F0562_017643 [Nyssa sinensis]|uniref:Uncharacterized protein n=1 Tax=Nyssa sinensis TaxID=561372 RepID=A0A5J4ZJG0_9ASTE|nr:hypothetical protein F0562_017643 [Nyssa sinensis]
MIFGTYGRMTEVMKEAYRIGYEDAQAERHFTLPQIDVEMVVVRDEIEEQIPLVEEHPPSSDLADGIAVTVEHEVIVIVNNTDSATCLAEEAND